MFITLSCPTLCGPMNCSPPDSSVRGILQARTLEWVAIPVSISNDYMKVMGLGKGHRDEERVSSPHFKGAYCQRDTFFILNLVTWLRSIYGVSPLVKLLLFSPFSYCPLWKEDIMHSSQLKSRELCFPS